MLKSLTDRRAPAPTKARADNAGADDRGAGESGFTLIEVLVALAIAALGLGAMMAAAGQGLGNVGIADRYIEATRRAQSHLAMVGITAPLAAGDTQGDDGGGFFWRVQIVPIAAEAAGSAAASATGAVTAQAGNQQQPPSAVTLYAIGVTVGWRTGAGVKQVTLQTQRIGQAAGG